MLEKMGWSEGEGLGREGAGRREPVSIEPSDEYPWIKFASINLVLLGLVFRSLSTSAKIACIRGFKLLTSLWCSNVAKQVSHFCCPLLCFKLSFTDYTA